MNLNQMGAIRQWLRLHGSRCPAELHAWDLVCMIWTLGWLALPLGAIFHDDEFLLFWLVALVLPTVYVSGRARLHKQGRLRCDWLTAL